VAVAMADEEFTKELGFGILGELDDDENDFSFNSFEPFFISLEFIS
jgi:hypothetical protein